MKEYEKFAFITIALSIISLFIEQSGISFYFIRLFGIAIEYVLILTVLTGTVLDIASEKYKMRYFKRHGVSFLVTAIFTLLFIYSQLYGKVSSSNIAVLALLLRNIFLVLRMSSKRKRVAGYVEKLTVNPAKTILLSFVVVIAVGTLLLMMDFATIDGYGLSFLQALFTATSCVCVTGLTVVDTATVFTFGGQCVLLVLIQIGGLGLMLLSYFVIFVIRRRVSLADKLMLSYMLSEDDTASIYASMLSIVLTTLIIEGIGAALLFVGFIPRMGVSLRTVWYALFHSISAFCNAGFALFPASLEQFTEDYYLLFVLSLLIIVGGIGFSCITNIRAMCDSVIHKKKGMGRVRLSLNTKVVLIGTAILLISGTLLFYICEFSSTMKDLPIGTQYMHAFFQSVTFRTAGFNSVSLGNLRPVTYVIFSLFMLIGAASGSTAGGMKVNTIAVLGASFYSYLKGENRYYIGHSEIAHEKVLQATLLFIADVMCVCLCVILLMIGESAPCEQILFETCSALGTAGVTAGLTPDLHVCSKLILILCMFWGRVGGLTILSSASADMTKDTIRWPQADISIG
ncbi:MAG: hypothetical protein K6E51_12280 [Treponema sp.]|nr:hypothetical protein [Treponema sp.]